KNLASYIKQRQGDLSTSFILRIFIPILNAVKMVHALNYLHMEANAYRPEELGLMILITKSLNSLLPG
ncbi:hypothetical protein TI03_04645, partial [Achromatium sp. WMS1]